MIKLVDKSDIKPRSEIKNVPNEIIEFEVVGFARTSKKLLKYIRENNISVKIFNPTKARGSNRINGPIKILGDYYRYYYKIECKKEFVNFLVQKLYKNNPDPEQGMRKAFTYILHGNGLHWELCYCADKDRHKYVRKDRKKYVEK